jgi:MFS transporter, OFA family, oxalate/formate antiporter
MNNKPIYYGYILATAATIILMVGYGTHYSYSVFFDSLSTEFNSAKGTISGAFSIAMLTSGLISILAGRLSDRLGPKAVCIFCGSALGVGFLLMSRVNSVWQIYLLYGLFIAIGAGGFYPAAVSTVARWFTINRGIMTGIVTAGLGLGSIIFSPLISHFITAYGWRQAYVIIGVIALVVILSASQFLKRKPEQDGHATSFKKELIKTVSTDKRDFTYREAIRTRQFWMLAVIYLLSGYGQLSLMVHIVPYATGNGITPISAASVLSVIGASSIFSRVITGRIGDRIRVKPLIIAILATLMVSLVWLEFAHELWEFICVGIIFGLGYGGSSTMQSLVAVEMFGLSSLGVLLGNFIFCICIGGSLGPFLTGVLYDVTNNYQLAFLICAITALASLVLALWLTPPKRRRDI